MIPHGCIIEQDSVKKGETPLYEENSLAQRRHPIIKSPTV